MSIALSSCNALRPEGAFALEWSDNAVTSIQSQLNQQKEQAIGQKNNLEPLQITQDTSVQTISPPEPIFLSDQPQVVSDAQELLAPSSSDRPEPSQVPSIQPIPLEQIPEAPSESPPSSEPQTSEPLDRQQVVLETLTSSAERYPYVVNPTDNLTFSPQAFRPNTHENYSSFDIRFAEQNPVFNQVTWAHFPQQEQFYWVLDGNRVVAETEGWQSGIRYQGESTETRIHEQITLQQVLWGAQAVWSIPRLPNLPGTADPQNVSLVTVSGAIINPPGVPAGRVTLDSGIDLTDPNVMRVTDLTPNLGNASTYSPTGGADLFQSLSPDEAPLILQGFPTVDLSPLLDDGNVHLRQGEIIPTDVLSRTGITWGNIFTGELARFTAPITSTPGLKIGRLGNFENLDLLSILVDPTLEGTERDLNYLNSLFWTSFGRRQPEFEILSQEQTTTAWHRAYVSHPHNRVAIDYDPVEIRATYTNIFANPGISVVLALDDGVDTIQTLHGTIGMALGGIFEAIDLNHINHSLGEARQAFEAGERFASLNTQATSAQRRQINQRLNQTLAYANFTSGLEQVSGGLTVPSEITPNSSNLLRLQTGLHRRSVQFLQHESHLMEGDTFISNLRLSNRDFGPLTFTGIPGQGRTSNPLPENEAFAVDVILTNPEGQQFVQQYNSADAQVNPLLIRGADLTFDRIELTRIDQHAIAYDSFRGYLSLPAVEMTWAGSLNNLNYSLSSGLWLNLDADEAPGVDDNKLGVTEPTLGLYANAVLNLPTTDITRDSNGNPISSDTYGPLLRLN